MAQYNYKAMDKNGKAKKGSIEAITPEKAKEKLKSEGLIVQEIKEQGVAKAGRGKKVKDKDLAVFCKQFASVLNAGVTIISCVESMPFLDLLYEATSAIGTVGLSTGITTSLSSISRVVIIALMYIGRLGPVTVGMGLLRKNSINADVRIKYPVTDIIVG